MSVVGRGASGLWERWHPGVVARPVTKRAVDLLGAATLLLVLSPLLLLAYAMVRLTSPGAGLFRQNRVGQEGRTFSLLKFRTMADACSDELHREYVARMMSGEIRPEDGVFKLDADPRVTRVGGFLRRTSIDELPQLINVLRGEMSLVGPRPVLPWEVEMFPDWASNRFAVRPGLTGLWQVSGRNLLTMSEGLVLDVEYVERRSFLLDMSILLRTVPAVLWGRAR